MPYKSKAVVIGKKKYQKKSVPVVSKAIKQYVKNSIKVVGETKTSLQTATDNTQLAHNTLTNLIVGMLATSQGTQDPTVGFISNRIGDEINLRGVKIKLHLQLNERYSQCNYRIFVIRSAKGDIPSTATFFNGLSSNKLMDSINSERYKVLAYKYGSIYAGNFGAQTASTGLLLGGGLFDTGGANITLYSPASKIVSMWIPASKITSAKNGKIKYENGGLQTQNFDYGVFIIPHASTLTQDAGGFFVLTSAEVISTMYFKDP